MQFTMALLKLNLLLPDLPSHPTHLNFDFAEQEFDKKEIVSAIVLWFMETYLT